MIDRVLVVSTTVLLFVAPFAGSSGTRGTALAVAALMLALQWRTHAPWLVRQFPRPVAAPVLGWALLATASVLWSVNPKFSAGELRPEIVYGLGALCVYFVAAIPSRLSPWMWALLAGAAIATLGVVVQPWIPPSVSRHPIDGGPGYLSTHLVLLAPPALAAILAGIAQPRRRAAYAALATLVIALAAWQTANRIVWLAFAAEIVTAAAAWRVGERRGGRKTPKVGAIAFACAAIAVIGFAASIVEREEQVSHYAYPEGSIQSDLRPRIWEVALQRFREAPWLGHGFGREILAEDFMPLTPREIEHPLITHAHNVFADIALELGAAGLALFVWLLVALAIEYWRMLGTPGTVCLGVAGLAVLAGFVVKNLTDDFFHRHNALVFWAVQGALLGLARRRGEAPKG